MNYLYACIIKQRECDIEPECTELHTVILYILFCNWRYIHNLGLLLLLTSLVRSNSPIGNRNPILKFWQYASGCLAITR